MYCAAAEAAAAVLLAAAAAALCVAAVVILATAFRWAPTGLGVAHRRCALNLMCLLEQGKAGVQQAGAVSCLECSSESCLPVKFTAHVARLLLCQ
jgi:hypothetical protein